MTEEEIEDEIVNRYFHGISLSRNGFSEQKIVDWTECKILLEELVERGIKLEGYFGRIYKRVSKLI